MKRILVIGLATVMLGTMSAVALADDDVTETEVEAEEVESEEKELSHAQLWKAQMIADYFAGEDATEEEVDAKVEEVIELRTGEDSVGWGALYKLMLLSEAGIDIEKSDDGWGFGQYFKELRESDPDFLAEHPKNLGQLKKQQRNEAKSEHKANKGNKGNKGKSEG